MSLTKKQIIEKLKDMRTCDTCGEQTDINVCWTDSGEYWCSDECVPKRKWVQMFGEYCE